MAKKKTEKKDLKVEADAVIEDQTATENADKADAVIEEESIEEIVDLAQMSPVGTNPFVLISRDEKGSEINAAQIGQKGCIVSCEKGICFVPGATIQQAEESNRLA